MIGFIGWIIKKLNWKIVKFKTGIYLGSNIDESSYEDMLSKENIVLFASKVFPERVHLKYKDKLNYFDENLDQIYSMNNLFKNISFVFARVTFMYWNVCVSCAQLARSRILRGRALFFSRDRPSAYLRTFIA